MKEKEVGHYVGGQLYRLQGLSEHPRKAALANLRRGIGRVPGEMPALWGAFLQNMPEEFQSKTGKPSREEWAIYLALTLYAMHQQGHALPEDNMNRKGESLGRAIRRLVEPGEDETDSSVLKRFNRLATAVDMREISQHLRGIVQLLRAKGVALDYPKLAEDLYSLQFPAIAPRVRLRWGQDYYAPLKNGEKDTQEEMKREND